MFDIRTPITILVLTIPFFIMTIWAVVNASQKDFGTMGEKALWMIVASIPFIGFIIYLIFGFRKGTKTP